VRELRDEQKPPCNWIDLPIHGQKRKRRRKMRAILAEAERRRCGREAGGTILINMMHRDCMEYMATLPDKAFEPFKTEARYFSETQRGAEWFSQI